ncbi:MAG TPA: hypothetical protein VFQ42_22065 [Mycobacterium sp.]|nr:hypothetical protein [Mycobacterium sp.]
MSKSASAAARRVACPACGVPELALCVEPWGAERTRSHPERIASARAVPDLTPPQLLALRKLHADPTRHIEPGTRLSLLRKQLIAPCEAPGPMPQHRRGPRPKRNHPLTEAGRKAIGLPADEQIARTA